MKKKSKKIYILFVVLSLGILMSPNTLLANSSNTSAEIVSFNQNFSEPFINKTGNFIEVDVREANSRIFLQGSPNLPVFRKTYEFNWNVSITRINFTRSEIITGTINESRIKTVSLFDNMNSVINTVDREVTKNAKGDNNGFYPKTWYTTEKSGGLNKDGKHVVFLTISVYPTRYNMNENTIEYITNATVEIEYQDPGEEFFDPDIYDLLIITPETFKNNLTELVSHKESYNVKTKIITLREIYDTSEGRDEAERIKYFIKDAVETWGIEYVLLVGEIRKTPIRQTDAYPWNGNHGEGILSDLYYSDIYDGEYNFSSWDSNEDMIFGQIKFNGSFHRMNVTIVDEVDLYPDVHVGRLACRSKKEVDIVVNKIINYEENTYGKDWFNRIILAGGDTFPPVKGSPFSIYEGEITNKKVVKELPEFEHIKLWATKHNFNAFTFHKAISEGAGFLTYAGHGFEHGMATYRPDQLIKKKVGLLGPVYFTPFIQFLKNKNKLPVIFFDACLTTKLDFNLKDIASYFKIVRNLVKLTGIEINENNHLPCFAWVFMTEENGGAIGTIGATRPAYSFVDDEGEKVHAGAGYLDWMFFRGYEKGMTLGEMLTYAQNSYVNNRFKDYFTIEEYLLLGDPSLMVGGYPPE